MQRIAVFACFRDNEDFLPQFFFQLQQLEKHYVNCYRFEYYFFENDSIDQTVTMLQRFLRTRKGALDSRVLRKAKFGAVIQLSRATAMAMYRNMNIAQFSVSRSLPDWILILDTNICYGPHVLRQLLYPLQNDSTIGMSVGFTHATEHPEHYYDTLAFTNNEGQNYKDLDKQCLFVDCPNCKVNQIQRQSVDQIDVQSAFGGFAVFPGHLLPFIKWDDRGVCEHFGLCHRIRAQGKRIVLSTKVELSWSL